MCLLGLEYLILTFDPYMPPKCQILASKWQFQAKMLKNKSPILTHSGGITQGCAFWGQNI